VIAHLTGILLEKTVARLVLDVGGVGYDLQVPLSTFYAVGEPGARVALRVHTHVREDAIQLFGFVTPLELALFDRLIGVNGIGPKVALAVLSGIEPGDLVRAIKSTDLARLTKIPGVGRKTAERLVLELKDRLPQAALDAASGPGAVPEDETGPRADVLSALANLGYQRASVEKTVDRVLARSGDMAFEPLLRETLKALS
jgi:Holliday junction DNA helicase RuvA